MCARACVCVWHCTRRHYSQYCSPVSVQQSRCYPIGVHDEREGCGASKQTPASPALLVIHTQSAERRLDNLGRADPGSRQSKRPISRPPTGYLGGTTLRRHRRGHVLLLHSDSGRRPQQLGIFLNGVLHVLSGGASALHP